MKILRVTPRHDAKGNLWIVNTDDHQTLATRSMFFATFADRARELGRDVTMQTAAGHYYRDILLIDFARPGHGESDPGTSPKGEL